MHGFIKTDEGGVFVRAVDESSACEFVVAPRGLHKFTGKKFPACIQPTPQTWLYQLAGERRGWRVVDAALL